MFVIEVIPLKRSIGIESLSYYSGVSYKKGALITVPLRKGEATAVVIDVKPVSAAKTALKTATFSLRKLLPQTNVHALPGALLATAEKVSTLYPSHLGVILFSLLPAEVRNGEQPYPQTRFEKSNEDTTPHILTGTAQSRYIAHRSLIRETFAHRGSVLFIVPTSAEIQEVQEQLQTGIENRVITFASTHTKKQLQASYIAFEDQSHAKLIITTPSYAFLDRHDITTIIVESSGSNHYVQRARPYLDIREVLKIYAKETGRFLLLADILPKTEDEIKRKDDIYATYEQPMLRLQLPGTLSIAKHKLREGDEAFKLITDDLHEAIKRTLTVKGNVFLYASRKGLAPLVICYDCGYIFRCPDSGAPYSLLRTIKNEAEERWFISTTSGRRIRASDTCTACGSWRLKEQGIGIQFVYDEVRKLFPKETVILFDQTTATTHVKAEKIAKQFYEAKRAILIGTSMTLPYLRTPISLSSIISYEATRSIPTWRADETVFALLLLLREKTITDCIVQVRTEPDELVSMASLGLIDQFYESEIAVRKAVSYPPYATFILLSWTGTKEQVATVETMLAEILSVHEVQYYSAPESSGTQTLRYGLLRLSNGLSHNSSLIEILRTLPPYIKIEINPNRIV